MELPQSVKVAAAPVKAASTRFFYVYSSDGSVVRQVRCSQHGEIEQLESFAAHVNPLTILDHANTIYASRARLSNMSLQQLLSAASKDSSSNHFTGGAHNLSSSSKNNLALPSSAVTTPLTATAMNLLKNLPPSASPLVGASVHNTNRSNIGKKIESTRISNKSSGHSIAASVAADAATAAAME